MTTPTVSSDDINNRMSNAESLQLFEGQPFRTAWGAEAEEWFSIIDVVGVRTNQLDARCKSTYLTVFKKRLNEERTIELLTIESS